MLPGLFQRTSLRDTARNRGSQRCCPLACLSTLASLSLCATPGYAATHGRPVTVRDSISMRLVADSDYFAGYSLVGSVANFSGDARAFVVVVRRGNLNRNTNDYTLLKWSVTNDGTLVGPR